MVMMADLRVGADRMSKPMQCAGSGSGSSSGRRKHGGFSHALRAMAMERARSSFSSAGAGRCAVSEGVLFWWNDEETFSPTTAPSSSRLLLLLKLLSLNLLLLLEEEEDAALS